MLSFPADDSRTLARSASCRATFALVPIIALAAGNAVAQVEWSREPLAELAPGAEGEWDAESVFIESAWRDEAGIRLWYRGTSDPSATLDWKIGCAVSPAGVSWSKHESNPCFDPAGGAPPAGGRWDEFVFGASVLFEPSIGRFRMWYGGARDATPRSISIGLAESVDGRIWARRGDGPVLRAGGPLTWEHDSVDSPCVLRVGGVYRMWYTGRDLSAPRTWQIGLATSTDGEEWAKHDGNPVLAPGGPGGAEAVYIPDVLYDEESDTYEMWFVHRTATEIHIGYATSNDGVTWEEFEGNPLRLPLALPELGTFTGAVLREGAGYRMLINLWHGGEVYRGGLATAARTLPRASFAVDSVEGLQVVLDSARSTSPSGAIVARGWDFGDGTFATGTRVTHRYASGGVYRVRLTVTDSSGEQGVVARTVEVAPPPPADFLRGDAGADGRLGLADAVLALNFLFLDGVRPSCLRSLDADDTGVLELSDPVFLLNYLFLGGPVLPEPFGRCGPDVTPDVLSCVSFAACDG